MKILLVGSNGTIGKAVSARLANDHEVITANYSEGELRVDLGSKVSIQEMFKATGKVDAVICTVGVANFGAFDQLPDDEYQLALSNKLMGQVNLVRVGRDYINEGGSVTLTSGVLAREPAVGSVVISMVNSALEIFAKAAALELDAIRLNVVSPIFIKETRIKLGMDADGGLSADETANAYLAALNGTMHGRTLDAPDFA